MQSGKAECAVEVEESQSLLFDTSIRIVPQQSFAVPPSFYSDGYSIIDSCASVTHASQVLHEFISSLDTTRLPLLATMLPRMQLAKCDAIPVCDDIVQTGFQALHYDMGMPFLAEQQQAVYAISALYKPMDSQSNDLAKTRLVSIQKLMAQKSFGAVGAIAARLDTYVRQHGDGWLKPEAHNTQRLAIFARLLDAISGTNRFCDKIDTMIGQCFDYDQDPDGLYGLKQEQDFFRSLGLDVPAVEQQIALQPGQMLVFDNMRCVHGRVGRRRKRELVNFLYGVKTAQPAEINTYRDWFVHQCV